MIKTGLFTVFFSLAMNTGYAENVGPAADYPTQITVVDAKQLENDARLSLKGFITGRLRGDHYLFRDGSGEIGVEIDGEVWRGAKIGPDTNVILYGELERESGSVYVDVHRLEVIGDGR